MIKKYESDLEEIIFKILYQKGLKELDLRENLPIYFQN
jgi:hypothetical protein